MRHWKEAEIKELITGFKEKSLSHEDWTHEAHLLVACYYLYYNEEMEALIFLRSGIISLNNAQGVVNDLTGGYHETLTCFWIKAISHFMQKNKKNNSLEDVCNAFLQSSYANTHLPLEFYSKDHLFTVKARASWVEPDKRMLNFE